MTPTDPLGDHLGPLYAACLVVLGEREFLRGYTPEQVADDIRRRCEHSQTIHPRQQPDEFADNRDSYAEFCHNQHEEI